MNIKTPITLTIAGSDSGGGAGIQADIKTISSLGSFAISVITALTAQNTKGVQDVMPVSVDFVRKQIQSLKDDFQISSIKIGMVHNAELVKCIYEEIKDLNVPIIFDPVMISSSGHKLISDDTIEAIVKYLFPLATLITPNLDETNALANSTISSYDEIKNEALKIQNLGVRNILVKGGHLVNNEIIKDFLFFGNDEYIFESERIESMNMHGTGCTLSSAIATFMGQGFDLSKSVELAHKYVNYAIKSAVNLKVGNGYGPLNHFHNPLKLKL